MSDLTVACVLNTRTPSDEWSDAKKTGHRAGYGIDYVYRLRDRVRKHLSVEHQFVCLTDWHISDVNCRLLEHDWPGWWAKLELFRPGLFEGRVLYFDLDTDIVGPLDDLASYGGRFGMMEDWLHPGLGASGVMAWQAGRYVSDRIYQTFAVDPAGAMAAHRGDQNWIGGSIDWDDLRGLYPGQIVSRWEECKQEVPEGARVVCWHGSPKPHTVDWVRVGDRKRARKGLLT